MRHGKATVLWVLLAVVVGPRGEASDAGAVQREIRQRFPVVARLLEPRAALLSASTGSALGFEAESADEAPAWVRPEDRAAWQESARSWRVFAPASLAEPFVIEGEGVTVRVRPVGAVPAEAVSVEGRLVYAQAYEESDVLFGTTPLRAQELILLRSLAAPRRFEYALEVAGAAAVELRDGAVHFVDERGRGLVLEPPVILDAEGRRSAAAGRWELAREWRSGVRLSLSLDVTGLAYPLLVDPGWTTTGSMSMTRNWPTTTPLQNGKVLAVGGSTTVANTELYDPATGLWSAAGSMVVPRVYHSATLLRDGRVLVAGGRNASTATADCRIYDPGTGTWSATGSLAVARQAHTATLLADGRVLVAGGTPTLSPAPGLDTAELYDPASGSWSFTTGNLVTGRRNHTATLLQDGRVLVAGGADPGSVIIGSAEIFDPGTGLWTSTGSLPAIRIYHTTTLLPDGRVLAAGGISTGGTATAATVLYTPSLGTWSGTGALQTARYDHSATLLPSGKVLVAGGSNGSIFSSAETYDPGTGQWTSAPPLPGPRTTHAASLLPNGKVLVTGGFGGSLLATAALYDADAGSWAASGPMGSGRADHTTTPLLDGRVLVAGGQNFGVLATAEVYGGGSWSATGSLNAARYWHTATLLPNGRVLAVGGVAGGPSLASSELYDPGSGVWTPSANLVGGGRYEHTATLLPCGEVLVVGGESSSGVVLATSERYNPVTGRWRPAASLGTGRWAHAATLLADGRVLVSGGWNGATLASAEVYDPTGDTWTPVGNTSVGRYHHTQTLLPSGRVLAVGRPLGVGASAEVFDPGTGTWSVTAAPTTPRDHHAAVLLPNGRVLVAGGYSGGILQTSELYDPAAGAWTAAATMAALRQLPGAALLPDGTVLLAGGRDPLFVATSERYDVGRGENGAWRPVLSTATTPVVEGGACAVTGSGFRGLSEAGGGDARQSATNYPLVQLRRLDNEAVRWLPVSSTAGWSDGSFTSASLAGLLPGPALVTVFTNGIPSASKGLAVECTAPAVTSQPSAQSACQGGSAVFAAATTGSCRTYRWRRGGVPLAEGGHYLGTETASLTVSPVDAGDIGSYDVVVSSPCSSATATSNAATLSFATQPPTFGGVASVTPIGGTCGFRLEWAPASATCATATTLRYNVYRDLTPGFTPGPANRIATCVSATFFNDMAGVASGTPYYYVVRAEDGSSGFGGPCNGGVEEANLVEASGLISGACSTSTTPSDLTVLTVRSTSGTNRLEWLNPGLGPYGSTRIRYRTDVYPAGPNDGLPVAELFGSPGAQGAFDHTGLGDGQAHYYAAFVDNGFGSYSAGKTSWGRPDATTSSFKFAYTTGATTLSPEGVVPGNSYLAVSNDRLVHALTAGPAGAAWPVGWRPFYLGDVSQARPTVVRLPTTTVGGVHTIALVASQDGRVYCLDAATGAQLWASPVLGADVQAAASAMFRDFGGAYDLVLVGSREPSGDSKFYGLRLADGSIAWTFDNGGGAAGIGVIDGQAWVDYATNRVYFASRRKSGGSSHTAWALSFTDSGAVRLWSRDIGESDGAPAARGAVVYLGNNAGEVYALDAASGTPLWSVPYATGDGPVKGYAWPLAGTNRLYFSTTGKVHAVADTGATALPFWTGGAAVGGAVSVPNASPPLIVAGRVYVGGGASRLYSVDAGSATPAAPTSVVLGDPLVPKVIGHPTYDFVNGLVLVGSDQGVIYGVALPF